MAQFTPKKLDKNAVNGGNRFRAGDGFSEEVFNDPIEAILYLQENGGGGGNSDLNLKNGIGDGTVQQYYGEVEKDRFSKAYQIGSGAFGGRTQAGFTKEEFEAHYGETDRTGNPYETSRSFAFSTGSDTRARGRASITGGTSTEANEENAGAFGKHTVVNSTNAFGFGYELVVNYKNQFAVGKYNWNKDYSILEVGNGTETRRSNAIEVDKNGRIYCYLTEAGKNTNWHGDLLTRREIEALINASSGGGGVDQALVDQVNANTQGIATLQSEKVSKTDYAGSVDDNGNAGVIKYRTSFGTYVNPDTGVLSLVNASEQNILAKQSSYQILSPKRLDYAVKVGMTTNTITLTDEEKVSALEWIGALQKVETTISNSAKLRAYVIKHDGSQTIEDVSYAPSGYAMARYDGGGRLSTLTATSDNHCINKKYFDDKIAELLARIEALESK